ncbi:MULTISPECIES: SidA/IucD/PvdA family monooxygenase [unclassified Paraburkholderia]|uniref:SidA/IucD/PvdA family monooxygenase n=1 Tax=unclassified Paraburkholderia TaxID=2615204 RepID=UPI00161C9AFB|nr:MULTISPECIES: SidA/IucD/PvdA family monooxygenase [unclassified Paraburkholderia]MBB5448362.1 L-ornithine N5-oxygenase [Paraburkholderia sp. WSM4177]MBB5488743.1 L-ornithine N5-oxygenase [Paraburkholderia sp. WSM4180]
MDVQDLVGIGFGPSHIGLAVSLQEDYREQINDKKIVFLEAKEKHGWHHPMLLPGSRMQISFMKDLCFLRNPRSRYTFINYLHEHKRLTTFANLRDFNPSRREFDDYLRWVADHFNHLTCYSSRVEAVVPVVGNGEVRCLDLHVRNTHSEEVRTVRTRNLAVAIGGEPVMPVDSASPHVFHASCFLEKISKYDNNKAYRFLVVGAGQSAAEIYQYLIANFIKSDIRVVSSGIGFKQADESEYVNEIFDNKMVDRVYGLGEASRRNLLRKHFDTNYSVVDQEIIQSLYRDEYEASVSSEEGRFGVLKFSRLVALDESEYGLTAVLESTLEDEVIKQDADVIICATGYSRKNSIELLKNTRRYWLGQPDRPHLSRNYAIRTLDNFYPGIYVQGMSESTHGLSDTLLSVIARRAHEVSSEIVKKCVTDPLTPEAEG